MDRRKFIAGTCFDPRSRRSGSRPRNRPRPISGSLSSTLASTDRSAGRQLVHGRRTGLESAIQGIFKTGIELLPPCQVAACYAGDRGGVISELPALGSKARMFLAKSMRFATRAALGARNQGSSRFPICGHASRPPQEPRRRMCFWTIA